MALARAQLSPAIKASLMGDTAMTPAAEPAKRFVYVARKTEESTYKPSPQQQAFFDWILDGSGNLILQAVAGAGKTTTLIQGLSRMEGSVFFGAYNRKIADEIKAKASKAKVDRNGIYINTLHGCCFSDWRRLHKQVSVDDRKVQKIVDDIARTKPEITSFETFVLKMVSFAKQFLIGVKRPVDHMPTWKGIMEHFSVDAEMDDESIELALEYAVEVFKRSAATCKTVVDFDDMIFAPLYYNIKFFQNDWVLIDECQDINPARREAAKRLLKPTGRFVAVGDRCQAIYGFTGAGGDSVDRIIEEFKCAELPLTVTYRCPKSVVSYVHQWVSHIEAHPDAPEGVVRPVIAAPKPETDSAMEAPVKAQPWFLREGMKTTDAVLCRYTRPLIQTAFAMIRAGVACKVEGRDIGNGLCKLAQRWKVKSLDALETRLAQYLAREIEKAKAAKSDARADAVTDVVETLRIFIDRCRAAGKTTIKELTDDIQTMFADDVAGMLTLSTGHKAKGREWPRVYWIQTAIRQRNLKDWEMVQETNIKYVIGTRAQEELVLLQETDL